MTEFPTKWYMNDTRTIFGHKQHYPIIQHAIHISTIEKLISCMQTGTRLIIACFAFAIVAYTFACDRGSDTVVVDFEKTVAVKRPMSPVPDSGRLNVAVAAMISPKETLIFYQQLLDYIGVKLGREMHLIQRKTYGEINELIGKGQIDLAFICSGPYAAAKDKHGFEALVTPVVRGKPFYQSYLIVNQGSPYRELEDLRGRTFALSDPDSNTGSLVPKFWLSQIGETVESFFKNVIYTYSHDNSILTVARSLVDGAAVDGHKWEYYNSRNPTYTSKTRVIKKSRLFGSPPLVASITMPDDQKQRIRDVLYRMPDDADGQKILEQLMIERFAAPRDEWYEPIRAMYQGLSSKAGKIHAQAKPQN
ncbi:MAG: phosphate/phosphite/phosphonate ABC transporter substrate-binding protein [Desulfobacterales bacterium]|nr:MAG: phosphate/phosphite/phosphonate ABC transporter substrate-binding protein [Desulfobacterales bacterium]